MECHELDIEVRPNGEVLVHVRGVKGKTCLDYVKVLEDLLGGPARRLEHTHEYYEPPTGVQIRLDQKTQG